MGAVEIHHYFERISNLLRSELRHAHRLQPVQFDALVYLKLCNHYSNTPQGVTDYLGLTKGTVSQTLKSLEKKGLVVKNPDEKDKRRTHLNLTPKGTALVRRYFPAPLFVDACSQLDTQTREQLGQQLEQLLRATQHVNNRKTFGVCHSCRFNRKLPSGAYFCELTKETLSKPAVQLICREHESGTR